MKLLKKGSTMLLILLVLLSNVMNVSANHLSKDVTYDLKKGGAQYFQVQDEEGKMIEVIIEEVDTSAYSPFHSVITGMILYPSLTRNSEIKATYSFLYKQAAMNYSTGVVAQMSGTEFIVGQK